MQLLAYLHDMELNHKDGVISVARNVGMKTKQLEQRISVTLCN